MDPRAVKVKAVVFDVYGTLLDLVPVADAERVARAWDELCRGLPSSAASPTYPEFRRRCEAAVVDDHAFAKQRGISYPEVEWPDVVSQA